MNPRLEEFLKMAVPVEARTVCSRTVRDRYHELRALALEIGNDGRKLTISELSEVFPRLFTPRIKHTVLAELGRHPQGEIVALVIALCEECPPVKEAVIMLRSLRLY